MYDLHLYFTITQAHSKALVICLLSDAYRARSLKFTAIGALMPPPLQKAIGPEKPWQYFEVLNISMNMQINVKIVIVNLNFQKTKGKEITKKKLDSSV